MMFQAVLDPQESRLVGKGKKKKKEPSWRCSAYSLEFFSLSCLMKCGFTFSVTSSDSISSEFISSLRQKSSSFSFFRHFSHMSILSHLCHGYCRQLSIGCTTPLRVQRMTYMYHCIPSIWSNWIPTSCSKHTSHFFLIFPI